MLLLRRFLAYLIDFYLFYPYGPVGMFLIGSLGMICNEDILVYSFWFLFFIYKWLTHGILGKTIGKYFLGIEVIAIDETELGLKRALLREIFPSLYNLLFSMSLLSMNQKGPVEIVFSFMILSDIIVMLTSKKWRSIHDKIGSSIVRKSVSLPEKQDINAKEV